VPTIGRPHWLVRSVRSVLDQSYEQLEVIVIVDGPDRATALQLEQFTDERVKVYPQEKNVGGATARNIGVSVARGEWIAFLDDDDFWLPEKLEKQMRLASTLRVAYPIISTRVVAQSLTGARLLPRRLYKRGQSVSEYLFCRNSFVYGDGMLQTSTLLIKRRLLLEIPFTDGLVRHQDWDWILKVADHPDVAIAMLLDPLTVMHVEGQGGSVSRSADWEYSLAWAQQNKKRMSRKAYSFFITTECVPRARQSEARWDVFLRLLWESIWAGQPGMRQTILFIAFSILPERARQGLRDRKLRTQMEGRA
jgi:glycosyltransferase involved in cell wall biosynthesis